jgi:hypothetical protein
MVGVLAWTVGVQAVSAQTTSAPTGQLQYSYLELGFAVGTPDEDYVSDGTNSLSVGDAAIFSLQGSFAVNETVFLEAGIALQKQDITLSVPGGVFNGDFDTNILYFGLGAHFPIQERVDLYGVVGFAKADQELSIAGDTASGDDNGLALRFGLRAMASDVSELGLYYARLDFDEAETTDGVGGEIRFHTSSQFSLGLEAQVGSDFTTIGASARFGF